MGYEEHSEAIMIAIGGFNEDVIKTWDQRQGLELLNTIKDESTISA